MGYQADIILCPEFSVYLHGDKSLIKHITNALDKKSLIIIVCDGVKNKIADDPEIKNNNQSMTTIILNMVKEEVNARGNEEIIDNLNFKLFDMNLMICSDDKISVTDLNMTDLLGR